MMDTVSEPVNVTHDESPPALALALRVGPLGSLKISRSTLR
jgi:hypothetical protein